MSVSLEQLKAHARVDFEDDDDLLARKLSAAIEIVEDLIGYKLSEIDGALPASLGEAVLMLAAHLYEHRMAVDGTAMTMAPLGFMSLVTPHRRFRF